MRTTADCENYGGLPDCENYGGLPDCENYGGLPDCENYGGLPNCENYGGLPDCENYGGLLAVLIAEFSYVRVIAKMLGCWSPNCRIAYSRALRRITGCQLLYCRSPNCMILPQYWKSAFSTCNIGNTGNTALIAVRCDGDGPIACPIPC